MTNKSSKKCNTQIIFTATDSIFFYTGVNNSDTYFNKKPAYLDKKATHLDKESAYLDKKATHLDKKPAYLDKKATHLDKKPAYLDIEATYIDKIDTTSVYAITTTFFINIDHY